MINLHIYDDMSLKDVLVMGSHNYEEDEFYLRVEEHNLVSTGGLSTYDDNIDEPNLKRELLEHPDRFTLDGKPITELSLHRWFCDVEGSDEPICQVSVVLYN